MTKAECHGCIYCEKPKGKKQYWCMVPYSKMPIRKVICCAWWHHYGTYKTARQIQNRQTWNHY